MKKILIVDDALFSRNIMKQMIMSGGHEALEAGNGTEAVSVFKSERPDAVTMDLLMPDMDGIDAVKKILKIDPEANIIICSTDKQKFRKEEAREAGAVGFIPKPVDPEKLLDTLKNIFSTS